MQGLISPVFRNVAQPALVPKLPGPPAPQSSEGDSKENTKRQTLDTVGAEDPSRLHQFGFDDVLTDPLTTTTDPRDPRLGKRQQGPLIVVSNNNVPIANEVVHNNNSEPFPFSFECRSARQVN